jgi:hypothetical protein
LHRGQDQEGLGRGGIEHGTSTENEFVASLRASEDVEAARATMVDLGRPPTRPTFLGTDNKANLTIAMETGTPSRLKHALRRYQVLQSRVRDGIITMGHVPDADNPADFLTKFVSAKKLEKSVAYLTNSANVVLPGTEVR